MQKTLDGLPQGVKETLTTSLPNGSFAAIPAAGRGWAHFSTRPEPIIHQMLARSPACAPPFRRWIDEKARWQGSG